MAQDPAGYSGTPLWKKLGLKPGMTACVIGAPPDYAALIAGGPVVNWGALRHGAGFIHLFTPFRAELEDGLRACLPLMARDGMIWVSWPKKASRLPCDYTEDTIREVCLPLGLVDIKVCAVSDIWSGLKLMIRKERR
jgi:hypothetical protein